MLNNKGQSLVIFIIMIPIFILLIILVYDIGNLTYEKQELDNINKIIIEYGLDNYDKSDVINNMYSLARNNNKEANYNIKYLDNEFYIESKYYIKSIFTKIINTDGYLAKSSYKGYINKDKYIIKKIKQR